MKAIKNTFHIACLLVLAGCSGNMQGVIRGDGTPVQFQYEQGMDRDFYTAQVDGENFSGQAIDAGASTGVGSFYTGYGMATIVTTTYSGNMVAVLMGDRGSSMRCNMTYADSSGLTNMGGVGICQMSDGRVIDVSW